MKYYGLIIPRSYNDYFSRSDPQALKDVVAMSTDAQLDTESAAPIQNKAVAKLIPATASEENQLADKNFVNSTVGTNTANYIYKTDASGDNVPFESIEELEAYSGTVTNNDYAFVTGIDENGNKYFDRYKANVDGDAVTWAKEYRLNNSSFTAEQWASIESGITSELVAKIGDAGIVPITTADYNELSEEEKMSGKLYLLTDAQNGFITITDEVEAGNMSAVTSNAVNGALAKYKKYVLAVGTHEVENLNNYNFITIGFINSNNNVFNTSTLPIQIFKEVLNLNVIYSYPGDNHLSATVRYVNDTSIAVSNNANWNTLIILHN